MRAFSRYVVKADIELTDGPLAGTLLTDGYKVYYASEESVGVMTKWVNDTFNSGESVRACAGKSAYVFRSPARVETLIA